MPCWYVSHYEVIGEHGKAKRTESLHFLERNVRELCVHAKMKTNSCRKTTVDEIEKKNLILAVLRIKHLINYSV